VGVEKVAAPEAVSPFDFNQDRAAFWVASFITSTD
jgi:hypothetical protein